MKLKSTVLLATFVVAMGLLLGASTAQAATVNFDSNDSSRAIGITDLDIGGTLYDVDFVGPTEAVNVYGDLPGDFEFTTLDSAAAAVDAVNAALNAEGGVIYVGPEGGDNAPIAQVYDVGWSTDAVGSVPFVNNVESFESSGGTWVKKSSPDQSIYLADSRTWATFTLAGPPPEPVTIGGTVTGLEGSGLVLQNNGSDDLPIDGNGDFEFETPLTPGDTYDVTVLTQPEGQTCTVDNGSGTVPEEPVTDVAVTCVDAPNSGTGAKIDDTWYKGQMGAKTTKGWLTRPDGNLVQVNPNIEYFFKVCDDEIESDCGAIDYNIVLAIADFDGDGIFELDEVFDISLKTCGPNEKSFVAEMVITESFDVDEDPATVENFNQSANGEIKNGENNALNSKGCGWTSDNTETDLAPDITGRKCRFIAQQIGIEELPFTLQDLVDAGIIDDAGDLDCASTEVVADAGEDQDVNTGASVNLDGDASIPNNGSFSWAFKSTPKKSKATLSGANTANPTFTADKKGTYKVQLTYTVGTYSSTDAVEIVATDLKVVADAGEKQSVTTGDLVTLDGSGSTPEGGSFSWAFKSTPNNSTATLSGADKANPTFTADKKGTYKVELSYTVDSTKQKDTVQVNAEGEPPPDEGEPPPNTENVCTRERCADNEELQQECEEYLENCLEDNPEQNEDECVLGALTICQRF